MRSSRKHPDNTFGTGGRVTFDMGSDAADAAGDVQVQPDGKIVVAGRGAAPNKGTDIGVARLNADGTLDASFAVAGKLTVDFKKASDDSATGLEVLPDGQIVVFGKARQDQFDPDYDFAVLRLTADGAIDNLFSYDGLYRVPVGTTSEARGGTVTPAGELVLAGLSANTSGGSNLALARVQTRTTRTLAVTIQAVDAPDPGAGFELLTTVKVPTAFVFAGGNTHTYVSGLLNGNTYRLRASNKPVIDTVRTWRGDADFLTNAAGTYDTEQSTQFENQTLDYGISIGDLDPYDDASVDKGGSWTAANPVDAANGQPWASDDG